MRTLALWKLLPLLVAATVLAACNDNSSTGDTTTGGSTTGSVTPAATGTATLAWSAPTSNTNGTELTPLTGYTIYYGTAQNSLTKSVVVGGESSLTFEISGLTAGTWYFAIAANAADGTQSAMSNIGSKTI